MGRTLYMSIAVTLAGLSLTGCAGGFDDFGSQRRGINSDIAATHEIGPSSLYPGGNFSGGLEPKGTYPWQIDERH